MMTANPQAIMACTLFLSGVIIMGRYPEGTVITTGLAGAAFGLAALCHPIAAPGLFIALFVIASCAIPCRGKAMAYYALGAIVLLPSIVCNFNGICSAYSSLIGQAETATVAETLGWLFLWPYSEWSGHLNIGPGGLILLLLGLLGLKKMASERENHPRLFILVVMAFFSMLMFLWPGSPLRAIPLIKRVGFWLAPGLCAIIVAGAKIEDERADYLREVALILNLVYFIPRGFGWVDFWPLVTVVLTPLIVFTVVPIITDKYRIFNSGFKEDLLYIGLMLIMIALLPTLRHCYRQDYMNSASAYERGVFDTVPLDESSLKTLHSRSTKGD